MKRNLLLFCCIITLSCLPGCAGSGTAHVKTAGSESETARSETEQASSGQETDQSEPEADQPDSGADTPDSAGSDSGTVGGTDEGEAENAGSLLVKGKGFYLMEADADTTVNPAIELDGADGTFMFLYDILLSNNIQGNFEIKGDILTARASDGQGRYRFRIESRDVLRFVQKGSSKIRLSDAEGSEKFLKDNAKFTLEAHVMPTKEEVYAMRKKVLEGMADEDIETLTDNIKAANESLERSCIGGNLFERLSDPEDLSWNLLDKTGQVQTGWAFEGDKEYDSSSGMTYEQFAKKYGEPVMTDNEYDADALISIVQQMKDSLKSTLLKDDLENIIQNINSAKETHDVEYIRQIYYTVHDMDYFLLRYGIEDIGKNIPDMSVVSTYYGVLEVYR